MLRHHRQFIKERSHVFKNNIALSLKCYNNIRAHNKAKNALTILKYVNMLEIKLGDFFLFKK